MKYVITWSLRRLSGPSDQWWFVAYENRPTNIQITSSEIIGHAKAFNSRQDATRQIKQIERRTSDLGIMDIIEMTNKEVFEARLKGA